jgi:hypothetical protein
MIGDDWRQRHRSTTGRSGQLTTKLKLKADGEAGAKAGNSQQAFWLRHGFEAKYLGQGLLKRQ